MCDSVCLIPGMCLQRFVQAFADNPVAREKLMGSLLAAFDQRSWVTISNILVRITFGLGFGQVCGSPCAKLLCLTPSLHRTHS